MKKQFPVLAACVFASVVLLFSCQKEISTDQKQEIVSTAFKSNPADKYNTFKGPEMPLGNGYVRSWIRMNHLDQPDEIGVEITALALTGLPNHHEEVVLPLHHKAQAVTPFDHIGFDYHPAGHPPPGIFNVQHFDVHFYMMNLEERMAIPAVTAATLPLFNLAPPPAYMPVNYLPGAPVPKMGKHWLPPPPSFLPFTRVMLYGTYNGELKFVEPMATLTHLQSATGSSQAYTQPEKFAKAGNYPTIYNVYKDNKKDSYHISLSGFVARTAN